MHPRLQEVLKRDRIEIPWIRADGTPAKRPHVRFKCYQCEGQFPRKDVDIDHIVPVGPTPGSKLAPPELTWNDFIARLFTALSNLAIICKPCHDAKSARETAERFARLRELKDAS